MLCPIIDMHISRHLLVCRLEVNEENIYIKKISRYICVNNATLRKQYPALYSIVRHKGDTTAKVMETSPSSVAFRRDLFG
jgi:hypothetical protein